MDFQKILAAFKKIGSIRSVISNNIETISTIRDLCTLLIRFSNNDIEEAKIVD